MIRVTTTVRSATDAPLAVIRESRRGDIRVGFEACKEELDLARLLECLPDEAVFERS
jgi:hypothetical protein